MVLLLWSLLGNAAAADKVRLQLRWLHQFQFAGYYMALEKGFYRDAGLDVEILEGGPGAMKPIDAMLDGRVDFAIANSGLVIARMAGKPVVALAAIMQTSPIVWIVRGDSAIYTPQDLAGKRVMLMPAPESGELRITLRREGIDSSQLQVLDTSFNPQDLVDGKVDAFDGYISNEPYWLMQHGVDYRLINPREYGVNFYNDVLATRESLIAAHPERVEAFVRASLKGWRYALEHVEESVQLIHGRYASRKSLDHLRYEAYELQKLIMPELVQLGHMNPGRWEAIASAYVQIGLSPGPIELEGFLYHYQAKADYSLLYKIAAGALLALTLVGATALRFARLSRTLRQEVQLRRSMERQLRESNLQLEHLANTDRLTGLWNRLKFEEVATHEVKRAQRYRHALSLVFFDIDRFKAINDTHGHEGGDAILRETARRVRTQLRDSDLLCRWGGEEFVVLMPHTDLPHALTLAEKLRELLAHRDPSQSCGVTASFGVSQLREGQSLQDLLRQADQALYLAKQRGRNRVETLDACHTGLV